MLVNAPHLNRDMPLNCRLLRNWKLLQGRRENPSNRKTNKQLFKHSAIERLPRKRQCCTGNMAELHFTLSKFLPSFSHLHLHIRACPSICSITRLGFFSFVRARPRPGAYATSRYLWSSDISTRGHSRGTGPC